MAQNEFPNLTKASIRALTVVIIFIVVVAMGGGCMTTTITSGEGAVEFSKFSGTDVNSNFAEGLAFHAPWVTLIRYDLRVQEQLEEITALTSNGLTIGLDASIRWRPRRDQLGQLHITYGRNYYSKLVQPELRSAIREIVGQFLPEELYSTRRQELQERVLERVKEAVESRSVLIDAILIRDIVLPTQIRQAIENKLQEEQEAERYQFTIAKERLEAQRKIIEAEGEAEFQRIITASLTSQFLRFKGIEATLELAASPNAKTIVIGSGADGLPLILGNN